MVSLSATVGIALGTLFILLFSGSEPLDPMQGRVVRSAIDGVVVWLAEDENITKPYLSGNEYK